jgi:hypothetical protein
MIEINTIGLDIAKNVFQVHGVDGRSHLRRRSFRYSNPAYSLTFTMKRLEDCAAVFATLGNQSPLRLASLAILGSSPRASLPASGGGESAFTPIAGHIPAPR